MRVAILILLGILIAIFSIFLPQPPYYVDLSKSYIPGIILSVFVFLGSWWVFKKEKYTYVSVGSSLALLFLLSIVGFIVFIMPLAFFLGCAFSDNTECTAQIPGIFNVLILFPVIVLPLTIVVYIVWRILRLVFDKS